MNAQRLIIPNNVEKSWFSLLSLFDCFRVRNKNRNGT